MLRSELWTGLVGGSPDPVGPVRRLSPPIAGIRQHRPCVGPTGLALRSGFDDCERQPLGAPKTTNRSRSTSLFAATADRCRHRVITASAEQTW